MELIASALSLSIASISFVNISGCWSYFVEMYCLIAPDHETECVFRKGMKRMLLAEHMSNRGQSGEAQTYDAMLNVGADGVEDWFLAQFCESWTHKILTGSSSHSGPTQIIMRPLKYSCVGPCNSTYTRRKKAW